MYGGCSSKKRMINLTKIQRLGNPRRTYISHLSFCCEDGIHPGSVDDERYK